MNMQTHMDITYVINRAYVVYNDMLRKLPTILVNCLITKKKHRANLTASPGLPNLPCIRAFRFGWTNADPRSDDKTDLASRSRFGGFCPKSVLVQGGLSVPDHARPCTRTCQYLGPCKFSASS